MNFEIISWVNYAAQIGMQIFAILTCVYLLWKYRHDALCLSLVLLCYPRIFGFFGKSVDNVYTILLLLFMVYLFVQRKVWKVFERKEGWLIIALVLLVTEVLVATLGYSQNSILTIFAQLSRYVEIFVLYFLLKEAVFVRSQKEVVAHCFYDIVLMNILISVFKYLALGGQMEGLVGSFTIIGGGFGTMLPLLGFINLWIYRKGKLSWYDWLYVLGLFIIGYTSGKRAVMFLLPVVIAGFMIYVQGIRLNKYILVALCAVPFVFYLGVRLTPTLNPERQVWGSFDWDYVIGYAENYQFGDEGIEGQVADLTAEDDYVAYSASGYAKGNRIEATGRGGATTALLKLIFSERKLTDQDLFGLGFSSMYGVDYATFAKQPLTIRINHKGSATGAFQSYVTTGVLGFVVAVLFGFLPFFYCKHRRTRWVFLALAVWDYFFYSGLLFRTPAFMAMAILAIMCVNYDYLLAKQLAKSNSTAL